MSEFPEIIKSYWKNLVVGAILFAIGISGYFVFATPVLIVLGAIVVAFPVARYLASSSGGLFYPGGRSDGKRPMYSVPQSKRAKGFYEEAITGYEEIALEYPKEAKPYIEMIDILILDLRDVERAKEVYDRGLLVLKNEKDKEVLKQMYEAITSRLNAAPSN